MIPRPFGGHASCGGPARCEECQREADDLAERGLEVVWAVRLVPGMETSDDRVIEWVNGRQVGFTDGSVESDVTWLAVRNGSGPVEPRQMTVQAEKALAALSAASLVYESMAQSAGEAWEATIARMVAARDAGVSMARIGAHVGLTRERVRQIINEWEDGKK